jgi:hypothetical protein
MSDVTQIHEEKNTFIIDVELPGHEARVTTPLFSRTRDELIKREGNRSFVTGKSEEEVGSPLEAHHFFIERCLAEGCDWSEFCKYIDRLKGLVDRADAFCKANPNLADIYDFVDDMTVNGMLIEKPLHTGAGLGIHAMPFPLWQFNLHGKQGFKFSNQDTIYHEDEAVTQPSTTINIQVNNP